MIKKYYNAYQGFDILNLDKLAYGGLILGSSQFSILPKLPQKMVLDSKVVKIDSKIIISSLKSKSLTHSVELLFASVVSAVLLL